MRQAVQAERRAALAAAIAQRLAIEETAFRDRAKPKAERDKVAGQLATANAAESKARAALTAAVQPADVYTPLAPRYPDHSTGRRLALAKWITDRRNPLAARVAVNHVWRWHFQKPLVATTADFGRNGALPTHPALLDWLAVEFMESGWSVKHLNRLIVTSNAYRMMSHAVDRSNQAIDPDNRLLWRFEPSRMEAEEVRDGLLRVAGALDESIGGSDIDYTQGLTCRRRSLYFTHHGEAKMQFLEIFDAPDACDAYKRSTSVVPQQALALTNNELLVNLAERIAEGLAGLDEGRFITTTFETVLSRPPTPLEFELSAAFLARQADTLKDQEDARERSRRDLIHALFSHNDFVTIH